MSKRNPFWFRNDIILRRLKFKGILENISPLRVGSGKVSLLSATPDLPVLKAKILGFDDMPIIPGSSFKGTFRSYAVRLSRKKGIYVCQGIPGNTCMDRKISAKETVSKKLKHLLKRKKYSEARELVRREACLLCKIFGSPGLLSKVSFLDSMPVNASSEEKLPFGLGIKPGIAINRRTGAIKEDALYFVEFVEPGSKFFFEFDAFNLPNYALGLLAQELIDLDKGLIRVGGFKSRGFGKVRFVDLRILIDDDKYRENRVLRAIDEYDEEIKVDGDPSSSRDDSFKLLEKLASLWWRASFDEVII